jgi:hypothetical protein
MEAAQAGLTIYTSDKPCKHLHGRQRYTSTGQCVACTKLRAKENLYNLRRTLADARREKQVES